MFKKRGWYLPVPASVSLEFGFPNWGMKAGTVTILKKTSGLAKEPIPEAELRSAKEYIKGNMYINAESNDSRMNRLAKNEFLFGRYVAFEEIEEKINRVTSEDIQKWFCSIYSPEKMATMLYGPVEMESQRLEDSLSQG